MSRYETFIVRLWIGDDGALGHGELRHLPAGSGFRFRRVQQAFQFIEEIASRSDGGPLPARDEGGLVRLEEIEHSDRKA